MSVRRASSIPFTFPLIDSLNRPQRKTGVILTSGDVQISKDGGSFANVTNTPSEIGTTGRYTVVLTAAEMDASWVHLYVTKSGVDDHDQMIATSANPSGTVVTDGSNSASTFKTDRTESTTDFWKDGLILFTTGSLAGQVKKVNAYNGTTKFITITGSFTSTPSNGDRFILVNL